MSSVILRTDGGARGNPGPAGAGFVIEHEGVVICSAGKFLGNCTNNVAEYEALIWGLENVRALRFDSVSVQADSELLVRQIQGAYKVKNAGLKPLFLRALALVRQFQSFEIEHVRREENRAADALANQAMDEQSTVGNPACVDEPPAGQETLF